MARIYLRFIARHYVKAATVNNSANIPVFLLCVEKYSRIPALQKDPYDRLLLAIEDSTHRCMDGEKG
jgi:PIN domain nuclease of toxin-antitoxin system